MIPSSLRVATPAPFGWRGQSLRVKPRPLDAYAVAWDGSREQAEAIIAWTGGTARFHHDSGSSHSKSAGYVPAVLVIDTPSGALAADAGDWIVSTVAGFRVCKPEAFALAYFEVAP